MARMSHTPAGIRIRRFLGLAVVLAALVVAAPEADNTIIVNTVSQAIDGTDGLCSLPEAIYSANLDSNIAIRNGSFSTITFITTECAPGNGTDLIVLPAGAVFSIFFAVDDHYNAMGPTATPLVFSTIVIEANGSRLEHAATGVFVRAFAVGSASVPLSSGTTVSGTGDLTIRNAHIKGFAARGGDGVAGGGGGMGAGGAIYVTGGALTVDGSTFETNGVEGGNGGTNGGGSAGGGGGGLSGSGGRPGNVTLAGPESEEGGGGGGGSRGDGGPGEVSDFSNSGGEGGGGGGTVAPGRRGSVPEVRNGGFNCGGDGGLISFLPGVGDDGDDGYCPGGGGGGGGAAHPVLFAPAGDGGNGAYGGGGGGGGHARGSGGHGGFGGGGGAGTDLDSLAGLAPAGGNGGFGGGGAAAHDGLISGGAGNGGLFAGNGNEQNGGGGAGLGGAIFNHGGTVTVANSTFVGNFAVRGLGGSAGTPAAAANGTDAGAAIFSLDGSLTIVHSTISRNETTGDFGGVAAISLGGTANFALHNTIIANNGLNDGNGNYSNSTGECAVDGPAVNKTGSGNLITQNASAYLCPGTVLTDDPGLGLLQLNAPGSTPTMAIAADSPAYDTGDDGTCQNSDQRGVLRPQGLHCDIGAYEAIVNTPPAITAIGVTREAGASATNSQVATVSDGEDSEATLQVTVNGAASAITSGVTVASLAVDASGNTTANVSATCAATNAAFTLRVTDSGGLYAEATLNVTVVDTTPPVVTSSLAQTMLGQPFDHSLLNVGLAASATDSCQGSRPVDVRVFGDENDESVTGDDGNFSPDARNIAAGTLRLRRERIGASDGRVYLVVTKAADTSGNTGFSCQTVVVPLDTKPPSVGAVTAQATSARIYCEANGGAPPAAYFVIGDGPILGKKQ